MIIKGRNHIERKNNIEFIKKIPMDKIPDFVLMHIRNLWTVDGLYFLGIEEKFGTETSTEIDRKVWEIMGKIEARRIKEFFNIIGNDLPSMMKALTYSSWALDLEEKEIIVEEEKAVIRNLDCRVQNTRIKKGLKEFSCKPVRFGFLKAFAKEFNPNINVYCKVCPPDKHPND
ncbi:MAG: DUF6125 family protein, partial [Candidatus Thermoplasmatota archaeon]|nr:DUF6125 family protein [Candidatus Thermoplasmatota archaeon]